MLAPLRHLRIIALRVEHEHLVIIPPPPSRDHGLQPQPRSRRGLLLPFLLPRTGAVGGKELVRSLQQQLPSDTWGFLQAAVGEDEGGGAVEEGAAAAVEGAAGEWTLEGGLRPGPHAGFLLCRSRLCPAARQSSHAQKGCMPWCEEGWLGECGVHVIGGRGCMYVGMSRLPIALQ